MEKYKRNLIRNIRDIAKVDRPREKLSAKGPEALSNLELLVVLVGCGIKGKDVFAIANEIASVMDRDFYSLSIDKLKEINGIGETKASQIMAAIEISRRFIVQEGVRIKDADDVLPIVSELRNKRQEYFLTLTLDGMHRLIERRTVFIGTLNQTLIHPREIFVDAISDRAAAIIFVHNHPDNDSSPSKEDILVTSRLLKVAEIVGIEVLDHIIITKDKIFSFRNKGLLDSKI